MDFTRQPIIETVITPKEGCNLVVRSSKGNGQEEYFVEALEVVVFGNAIFYRSMERPKSFLLPASDYEVLEVRETRMALKNVGIERTIKIGGGREQQSKTQKEPVVEKEAPAPVEDEAEMAVSADGKQDGRVDKKRDKRRHSRRRRGRGDETPEEMAAQAGEEQTREEPVENISHKEDAPSKKEEKRTSSTPPPAPPTLLPPPTTLISETIARYKDNALFRSAFYVKEPESIEESELDADKELALTGSSETFEQGSHPEDIAEALELQNISLEPSEYGYLGFMEEDQNVDFPVSVPKESPKGEEEVPEDALRREEQND